MTPSFEATSHQSAEDQNQGKAAENFNTKKAIQDNKIGYENMDINWTN